MVLGRALSLLMAAAPVPATRMADGLQARLLLTGDRQGADGHGAYGHDPLHRGGRRGPVADSGISTAPSASWRDRRRTALWLVIRLLLGGRVVAPCTVRASMLSVDLVRGAGISPLGPD